MGYRPIMLRGGASAYENISKIGRFVRPFLGLGKKFLPEIKKIATTLIKVGGTILSENKINDSINGENGENISVAPRKRSLEVTTSENIDAEKGKKGKKLKRSGVKKRGGRKIGEKKGGRKKNVKKKGVKKLKLDSIFV